MPSDAHNEAHGVVALAMGTSLEVFAIGAEHERLIKALSTGKPLCLDLSGVQACDVAGVQLLVSLVKTSDMSGRISLRCAPPDCVKRSAQAAGVPADFLAGIPLHSPDKL